MAARKGTAKKAQGRPRAANRPQRRGGGGRALIGRVIALIALGIGALFVWGGRLVIRVLPNGEQLAAFLKRPAVRQIGLGMIFIGVITLCLFGAHSHLEGQARFQIDPDQLHIDDLKVSWLKADSPSALALQSDIQKSVRESLAGIDTRSAFDDDLTTLVGEALRANPWIASVQRVERRFPKDDQPASLALDFSVRKPVLMVQLHHKFYLVDAEGVVLPRVLEANSEGRVYLPEDVALVEHLLLAPRLVSGVFGGAEADQPVPGKAWGSEQVKAALSIEHTLREHEVEKYYPARVIDVSDVAYKANPDGSVAYRTGPVWGVKLYTRTTGDETVVIWGKAPLHSGLYDPTLEQKLNRLKELKATNPTLTGQQYYRLRTVG